jgi:hypothetical protein
LTPTVIRLHQGLKPPRLTRPHVEPEPSPPAANP